LISQAAIFFERFRDDAIELRGQLRVDVAGRHRITIQNAVEHHCRGMPRETLAARRHLVEHDAERKQVRSRVDIIAPRLFG